MDPQEAMRKDGFSLVSWNLECIVDKKLCPDMLEERTEVVLAQNFYAITAGS